MNCVNLIEKALRAHKSGKVRRALERPFHLAGKTQPGWTSERVESGYAVRSTTSGGRIVISWQSPKHYRFEVHGHAFVLLDRDGSRLGEVRLVAEGPLRLVHSQTDSSLASGRGFETVAVEASDTVRVHLATAEGLIIDRGVSEPEGNWKVWKSERSLTYKVERPISIAGRSKLCVVFSAIGAPYDFTYNYRSALADVDAYRVYILDNFGSQGSYYFADHRDTSIFETVQELLHYIADDLEIAPENTAYIGSSKGGTAALAHGLKLGVGRIVVGAPQFFPGSYLKGAAPNVLSFIAGDDSPASVAWLDRLIPSSAEKTGGSTSISVLVGADDSHLQIHVQPLMRWAEEEGLNANALVVDDLSHQNIGRAFAPYAASVLNTAGSSQINSLLPYSFGWRESASENEAQLKLWVPRGEQLSVVFENGDGTVTFLSIEGGSYFKAAIPPGMDVRARVTRISVGGPAPRRTFKTRILNAKSVLPAKD